ncbi:HAD-IIB family hydrolase [Tardiphaga sp.]|uniref:HAD-IIB family hydrolase n=1 Tax=Tardiphaga sp. TaxID=1926292 RepID=UPI00352A218C
MKRLIAFDLDGTLAQSKQPLSDEMARALASLLRVAEIAIISGGDWPQFDKQVASRMPVGARCEGLWLMPTTGTKLYRFNHDQWRCVYAELFDDSEKAKIFAAFDEALRKAGLTGERVWGERIEDRGSQITFSGLGQQAPLAAKETWDPSREKRGALQKALQASLPGLSVNLGGTTSIDVTRAGIDKAYGLRRLSEESGIALNEMLFLGDALYPGGNDFPAVVLGVDTVQVRDVVETMAVITGIIACLRP